MILMILLLLQDSLYSFFFILFAFEVEMYGGNHLTILSLHTYRIRQIAEIAFSRRLLQRKNTLLALSMHLYNALRFLDGFIVGLRRIIHTTSDGHEDYFK